MSHSSRIMHSLRAYATKASSEPTKLKRFWKRVDLGVTSVGYNILLDGKALKSPSGSVVTIPLSNRMLAVLACLEWEGQDKTLKASSLPMTSIAVRALDSLSDSEVRAGVISNVLSYLHTDSVLYHQDYPESFEKMQHSHWHPLIKWMDETHGLKLKTTFGIASIQQEPKTMEYLRTRIETYDLVTLAAFEKIVLRTKSFVIALALLEKRISVEEATTCGRLEVMHQNIRWGEVEDAHDVDREEMIKQLGAARCAVLPSY